MDRETRRASSELKSPHISAADFFEPLLCVVRTVHPRARGALHTTADLACGAALEIRYGTMSGTPRQEVAKPAFAFHRFQEYTPKY